ncbi:hypothetical protein FQZ97_659090 [compost metagenome]
MRSKPKLPSSRVALAALVEPAATPISTPPAVSRPRRTPLTRRRELGRSAASTSLSTPLPPGWVTVPGRLGNRMTLPLGLLSPMALGPEPAWADAWSSLATGLS